MSQHVLVPMPDPDAAPGRPPSGSPHTLMLMRRRSSFFCTDLDLVLKALDADTVILTGVSTHRVVESTARDASDRDLRVLVASDCCGSDDQKFHDASLRAIADWFGKVHTSEEIMKELPS